jgi:sulfide dehydrogenase cytochrome subunit
VTSASLGVVLGGAALLLAALPATAQEPPPPGAAACSGCHAPAGGGSQVVPPITGRPAPEIAAAMRAYKAGERAPTVMDRIAKGFSDPEIEAIAAWLAAQG